MRPYRMWREPNGQWVVSADYHGGRRKPFIHGPNSSAAMRLLLAHVRRVREDKQRIDEHQRELRRAHWLKAD